MAKNDMCHSPEDWGWMNKEGKLFPITTSLPPTPAKLLEMIKCSCRKLSHKKVYMPKE